MVSFLTDDNTLAFLAYLGIFLTIYYSIHIRHKKIKYIILQNSNKYVVAFWNASSQAIFKEDIHHLYCLVNVDCKKSHIYSTDPDVTLSLDMGDDILDTYRGQTFNRHTRRMDIRPDFLNPKSGFLVELDNRQNEKYVPANFVLFGRIRGEKESSVHKSTPLDISLIRNPKELMELFLFLYSFATFSVFVILVSLGQEHLLTADIVEHFEISVLYMTVFSLATAFAGYNTYVNSAPKEIRRRLRKYKNNDYHEITQTPCRP